jgi:hypothetical protein
MPAHAHPAGTLRWRHGFVFIKVINHPHYGSQYVKRSHVVYYDNIGKPPPKGYDLHHKDKDRNNDAWDNLELLTHKEHSQLHRNIGEVPWNKGRTGVYSETHREKLRQANSNRVWTTDAKQKIAKFASERTDLQRNPETGRFENES